MEKELLKELISQVSRLADNVEELSLSVDNNFHTGTFYDGKLVDGLMEIARSVNPQRWEDPMKK